MSTTMFGDAYNRCVVGIVISIYRMKDRSRRVTVSCLISKGRGRIVIELCPLSISRGEGPYS